MRSSLLGSSFLLFAVVCQAQGLECEHELLGYADGKILGFSQVVSSKAPLYLSDHRQVIGDGSRALFPGAAFTEMVIAGAVRSLGLTPESPEVTISNLNISEPLYLGDGDVNLATTFARKKSDPDRLEAKIESTLVHASAKLIQPSGPHDYRTFTKERSWTLVLPGLIYGLADLGGLRYQRQFRVIDHIYTDGHRFVGRSRLKSDASVEGYVIHPIALDAAFQAVNAVAQVQYPNPELPCAAMPAKFTKVYVNPAAKMTAETSFSGELFYPEGESPWDRGYQFNLTIRNEHSESILEIEGGFMKAFSCQHGVQRMTLSPP
jgi:hypothetical protein